MKNKEKNFKLRNLVKEKHLLTTKLLEARLLNYLNKRYNFELNQSANAKVKDLLTNNFEYLDPTTIVADVLPVEDDCTFTFDLVPPATTQCIISIAAGAGLQPVPIFLTAA